MCINLVQAITILLLIQTNKHTLFTEGELHYYWLPGSLDNGPPKNK